MNKTMLSTLILLFAIAMVFQAKEVQGQKKTEPWSNEQIMETTQLAEILTDSSKQGWPLIIAVNPDGMYGIAYEGGIKGSQWFGPAEKKENLDKLKSFLGGIDKDEEIVVYCGCCPFHMCPNIRPAFSLLSSMGFTEHKLLNLRNNIKEDWIVKGYPMKQ